MAGNAWIKHVMKTRATMKKKGHLPKGFQGMKMAIMEAKKTWKTSKRSYGEPARTTRRHRRKSRKSIF
jgi:hypothetical protein